MEKRARTPIQFPLRVLYIAFVILAIGSLVFGNPVNTVLYGGVAMAFDPFNSTQPFDKRSRWQRIWLYAHVVMVLFAMAILLSKKFG